MRDCRFRVAIVAVGRNECKELLSVRIRNGKEVVEKKDDDNESNETFYGTLL